MKGHSANATLQVGVCQLTRGEQGYSFALRASDVRSVVRSSMPHHSSEHQAQSSVHIILAMRSRETARLRSEGNENLVPKNSFLCDLRASFANFAVKSFSGRFFSFLVLSVEGADPAC